MRADQRSSTRLGWTLAATAVFIGACASAPTVEVSAPTAAVTPPPATEAPSAESTSPAEASPTATAEPTVEPTPSEAPDTGTNFVDGGPGLGDPYYPDLGNGGYDVATYDLALRWDPTTETAVGVMTIQATATTNLASFNLDLVGMEVTGLAVDGADATFARSGQELTITPAAGIELNDSFEVRLSYQGTPAQVPARTGVPVNGWVFDGDTVYVIGQPAGAAGWMPVNDHPSDKAIFTLRVTVPAGLTVASNGLLTDRQVEGDLETFTYTNEHPQAPYLTTLGIGDFELIEEAEVNGVRIRNAIEASLIDQAPRFDRTAEIMEVLTERFGPYPFEAYGVLLVDGALGAALETQTMSIFGRDFLATDILEEVIAHELAHQWFGNSLALTRWSDIWLNEGFATYAQYLWLEADEPGFDIDAEIRAIVDGFGQDLRLPPPGDPGAATLFSASVYSGGAVVLHALRRTIGDDAFFSGIQRYTAEFRDSNVTTDDLISIMEAESGQELDAFFQAWLFDPTFPNLPF
jgi:aminopeptidase N